MKHLILLFAFVSCTIMLSCDDPNSGVCGTTNPTEELEWLKAKIEEKEATEHPGIGYYIYQGRYDRRDVFVDDICCPACSYIVPVYDCTGETLDVTADQVTDKQLIWQSDYTPCTRM